MTNRLLRPLALLLLFGAAAAILHTQRKATVKPPDCLDMFKCKNGRCIPNAWRCDGDPDCEHGDDEENCKGQTNKCDEQDEYRCLPSEPPKVAGSSAFMFHLTRPDSLFSNVCIPKNWVCDGEFDCPQKDDESTCQNITCQADQIKCPSFQSHLASCIPKSWRCDGQSDCADMSDEKDCPLVKPYTCDSTEFKCATGDKCIFANWKCDGDDDCNDGSDEKDCQNTCDPEKHFVCKTVNFCIPKEWKCDGEADCADQSDETECTTVNAVHNVTCSKNEFACHSGTQCISKKWVCDGDQDCVDHSDETDCLKERTCTEGQRACANKICIDAKLFCNDKDDCMDGSDEVGCEPKTSSTFGDIGCDHSTEHTCADEKNRCIKYDKLCMDANPGSDCALASVCNLNISSCSSNDSFCECRRNKKGFGGVCFCPSGFDNKNNACIDIDECATFGTCDQICRNRIGSFECDCHNGYKLYAAKDANVATKCRAIGPDPLLLLSNRAAIRQYDLVTNKYHPLVNKLESAVAMDYWHKNKTLIWSDVSKEKIMMCQMNRTTFLDRMDDCIAGEANSTLVDTDISTPDGLAVDWVHGLLFWTDTGLDKISVLDLVKRHRKVIIDKGLDEPRAIAVDPVQGLIFWTDWGQKARIERAGMDGKDRMIIYSGNTVRWPNGLAVDILDQKIYWADAKLKMIQSCDYYGRNVRTVLHSHEFLRHPFSLTVFEERLYWTDWDKEGVLTVNKFKGDDVSVLLHGVSGPMTVRVYHEQAQPNKTNKCERHGCEQLCLPRAHLLSENPQNEQGVVGLPYVCECAIGYRIHSENPAACVMEAIAEELAGGASSSTFSIILFALVLVAAVIGIVGYIWRGHRARPFSQLQFDNPIYRRTIEDPDTLDLGDNSLGAIPAGTGLVDPPRLILNGQRPTQPVNTENLNAQRDFYHPANYGYDLPPQFSPASNTNQNSSDQL